MHTGLAPSSQHQLEIWSHIGDTSHNEEKVQSTRGFAMRYEVMTNRSDQRLEILYCLSAERLLEPNCC